MTLKMTTLWPARADLVASCAGFIGSFPPGTQWQLHRPIYGLRQAPRKRHDTLRTTLAALDFFLSFADPSLFVRRGLTRFFVLVYVDDLVFATPDQRALASMKEEMQRRHTCTDLGELLQITRDRATCTITQAQSHMVEQILTQYSFPFSNIQLTPLAMDHGLTALPSDEPFESSNPYHELVGCLICETEVYATAMAAQELLWLSFLLIDLGERPRSPLFFFTTILLCKEPRLVGKAKHIQFCYFLLRELQQRGQRTSTSASCLDGGAVGGCPCLSSPPSSPRPPPTCNTCSLAAPSTGCPIPLSSLGADSSIHVPSLASSPPMSTSLAIARDVAAFPPICLAGPALLSADSPPPFPPSHLLGHPPSPPSPTASRLGALGGYAPANAWILCPWLFPALLTSVLLPPPVLPLHVA
ncbi:unnamed protein product [Closterium sp. NIES-54]